MTRRTNFFVYTTYEYTKKRCWKKKKRGGRDYGIGNSQKKKSKTHKLMKQCIGSLKMKEIQIQQDENFKVIRVAQIKKFDSSQYCRFEKTGSIIRWPGNKLVQPFGRAKSTKTENTKPSNFTSVFTAGIEKR